MSNKNINDNSKKDKGLIGNEKIEEAIFDLQKNHNAGWSVMVDGIYKF